MLKRALLTLALLVSLASNALAASGLIILPDANGNPLNYGTITSPVSCPAGQTAPCVVNNSTTAIVDGVAGAFAAGVTAPNTAPLASQPALNVTISPNSPVQAVTVSGAVTANAGSGTQNVSCVSGCSSSSATFGAAFPATGTAIGMTQGGNLTALSGTSGNLNVNLAASTLGTLTVSGTVTANAGTNMSTAALALESGGNLATIAGSISSTVAQNNVKQFGGNNVVTGTGVGGSGIPRVTVSNDSTLASKDFQNDAGTNGFTQAPFSVLTTELNALASAGVATSSVNGSSGVFSQSTTGNDIIGRCWVKLGAALGGAASAGANFAVWYLTSTDGGTTFESATVSPPPRSPDLIIPVGTNAYGSNAVLMGAPRVYLWAESVKIVLQNNTGQAMGASGNIMTCAGEAQKY